jgi:hypothetical protein
MYDFVETIARMTAVAKRGRDKLKNAKGGDAASENI